MFGFLYLRVLRGLKNEGISDGANTLGLMDRSVFEEVNYDENGSKQTDSVIFSVVRKALTQNID